MLTAELASIRRRDPDLDAGDITMFTLPLVVRVAAVAALAWCRYLGLAGQRLCGFTQLREFLADDQPR